MILLKLLPLIPVAQFIVWAMLGVTVWLGRDLVLDGLRRYFGAENPSLQPTPAVPVRRRVRWKVALLSGLAATELVLFLVGVTA